ncbi:response regulator transcription factor [Agromyces mangrovi Wang et al. 2018]|uniref:response regulator transcription factor n=1 Tax=Agromyces mangrovi TaxID=1858653 RepID=UPI00257226AB|nr:response regulator transcription factor [Agromyces mangrovi]
MLRDEVPLSPRAARAIVEGEQPSRSQPRSAQELGDLTSRELDIVRLVALGLSNDEIGRRLSISPATAKTHLRNAMRKLGLHDRSQVVALAYRVGLG